MKSSLRFFERFEDYKIFFRDGVTEDSVNDAINYALLRGYGMINQIINDKYYFGMERYLYDSYLKAIEQRILFRKAGYIKRHLTCKECYYDK